MDQTHPSGVSSDLSSVSITPTPEGLLNDANSASDSDMSNVSATTPERLRDEDSDSDAKKGSSSSSSDSDSDSYSDSTDFAMELDEGTTYEDPNPEMTTYVQRQVGVHLTNTGLPTQ